MKIIKKIQPLTKYRKLRKFFARILGNQAERRAGEMLKDMDKAVGGQPYQSTGNMVKPVETLEDLGISNIQSHRWQLEAEGLNYAYS